MFFMKYKDYVQRGSVRLENGEIDKAISDLSRAREMVPTATQATILLSSAYARKGDMAAALDILRPVGDMPPLEASSLLVARARLHEQLDAVEEALDDFQTAVKLNPNNFDAHFYRGRLLALVGRPKDAIADFDHLLDQCPTDPELLYARGNTYERADNYELAICDYRAAIDIQKDNFLALKGLGRLLHHKAGRSSEALNTTNTAISFHPAEATLYALRSEIRRSLGENRAAADDLTHALALEPDNADWRYSRATALAAAGDYASALPELDQYLSEFPEDRDALDARGYVLFSLERFADSIAEYTKAIEINGPDADLLWGRGLAHLELMQNEAALGDFAAAIELGPVDADQFIYHAFAAYRLGRSDIAVLDCERALAMNPQNAEAMYLLGQLQLEANLPGGQSNIESAVAISPTADSLWRRLRK